MKAKRWSRTVQGTIVGLVVVTAGALGVVAGGPLAGAQAAVAAVERVSVSSYGGQGDGNSWFAFISADGRYVCFMSEAPGLTDGDTNGLRDSILHDRQTGATERVSVSSTGHEGNGASYAGPVSLDGRYVAFTSEATNLEPAVKYAEALLRDRASNTVTLLTPAYDGSPSNGRNYADDMTPDGRFVAITAFSDALVQGDTNGVGDMVLLDRQSGSMELASLSSDGSPGDGASGAGAVSDDGRVVAFQSDATNLVPGDTNGATDIFVRNLDAGTTERVSVSSAGVQGDGSSYGVNISPDGRYVVFYSHSSNLVPSDTNGDANDVFIHDLTTGVTELVSVSTDGLKGDAGSHSPDVSEGGRFVVFASDATNLVPGDTNGSQDVLVRDRQSGTTERLSVSAGGAQSDGGSYSPTVSNDGRYVAFESDATNLVPGDTNGAFDVFVVDRGPQTVAPPLFTDVASSPYKTAIESLAAAGVVGGYETQGAWEFRPNNPLWRAQFAKMIVGSWGFAVTEGQGFAPFTDLGQDDIDDLYPHEYVGAAYQRGITKGTTATTFGPYVDITRAQLITMVVRSVKAERPGSISAPPPGWTGVLPSGDPDHGTNIKTAEYSGLLAGIALSGWDVWGKATRGETAQILYNMRGM